MTENIQMFPKERSSEPSPGSTRLGGGVGMDRKIEKPRFTPKRIAHRRGCFAVGRAIRIRSCSRISGCAN